MLRWEQQIRLRNMLTRLYLCIDSRSEVSLIADPADPRTVFRLHSVLKVCSYALWNFTISYGCSKCVGCTSVIVKHYYSSGVCEKNNKIHKCCFDLETCCNFVAKTDSFVCICQYFLSKSVLRLTSVSIKCLESVSCRANNFLQWRMNDKYDKLTLSVDALFYVMPMEIAVLWNIVASFPVFLGTLLAWHCCSKHLCNLHMFLVKLKGKFQPWSAKLINVDKNIN